MYVCDCLRFNYRNEEYTCVEHCPSRLWTRPERERERNRHAENSVRDPAFGEAQTYPLRRTIDGRNNGTYYRWLYRIYVAYVEHRSTSVLEALREKKGWREVRRDPRGLPRGETSPASALHPRPRDAYLITMFQFGVRHVRSGFIDKKQTICQRLVVDAKNRSSSCRRRRRRRWSDGSALIRRRNADHVVVIEREHTLDPFFFFYVIQLANLHRVHITLLSRCFLTCFASVLFFLFLFLPRNLVLVSSSSGRHRTTDTRVRRVCRACFIHRQRLASRELFN